MNCDCLDWPPVHLAALSRFRPDAAHGHWDRSYSIPKLLTQQLERGERTYVIYGPGGHPYAQITGSDIVYYHRDQLGPTRLLTDAGGDPVGSFTTTPTASSRAAPAPPPRCSASQASTPTPKRASPTYVPATTTPPPGNSSPATQSNTPQATPTDTRRTVRYAMSIRLGF